MKNLIDKDTIENIIKNNELIALFMGGRFETNLSFTYTKSGWFDTPANDNCQVAQSYSFKYHSDWNWLMPVIEKICTIKFGNEFGFNGHTFLHKFGMQNREGQVTAQFYGFELFQSETIINATYLAVIDFVKWYNISIKTI